MISAFGPCTLTHWYKVIAGRHLSCHARVRVVGCYPSCHPRVWVVGCYCCLTRQFSIKVIRSINASFSHFPNSCWLCFVSSAWVGYQFWTLSRILSHTTLSLAINFLPSNCTFAGQVCVLITMKSLQKPASKS